MITRIDKLCLIAATAFYACFTPSLQAVTRVDSYDEALEKAGDDGILIYCYGPDWNARSVRMLKSFWKNNPELEEAAGDAVLLAAPFYQSSKTKGADKAKGIRGGMPEPLNRTCPSVLMLDKKGHLYASLLGSDGLIENKEEQLADKMITRTYDARPIIPTDNEDAELGKLGVTNIAEKLAIFRQQQELIAQAKTMRGEPSAKLISQAIELPIEPPENAEEILKAADPTDAGYYLRRFRFDPRKFIEKELEIVDGVMSEYFYEERVTIHKHVMEVVRNKKLRLEDRQQVFCLLLGAYKRDGYGGRELLNLTRQAQMLTRYTPLGLGLNDIMIRWGGAGTKVDREARDKVRAEQKAQKKLAREKMIKDKRAQSHILIE